MGSPFHGRVLEGLRRLGTNPVQGRRFTREEIAEACDCDKEYIRQIERRALRKARGILELLRIDATS